MTKAQMAELMKLMHDEENTVREAGHKEYAHNDDNIFTDFEALAAELGISRKKVLWVYLIKHMRGILAYINGHRSQRESVQGRIKDARMYLALLRGMIEEDQRPDVAMGERLGRP